MRVTSALQLAAAAAVAVFAAPSHSSARSGTNGVVSGLYSVSATRILDTPLLSTNNSNFDYTYNAALYSGQDGNYYIIARCQNISNPGHPYDVTPSSFAISAFTDFTFTAATPISNANITFSNETAYEACGTEDPRVAYNPRTFLYELFYTGYNCTQAQLCIATNADPRNPATWTREGRILIDQKVTWSKSGTLQRAIALSRRIFVHQCIVVAGAAILNAFGTDYLIWGDTNLTFATSPDGIVWTDEQQFMTTRSDGFDSNIVVRSADAILERSPSNFY
jgi:predicted GH43/DUF377 family glycosyl hydrolase